MSRTATMEIAKMAKTPAAACETDDRALLRAIAEQRDRAAFAELFARHQQAAYNLARHLMSSRDAAEDVVQEALLRIWANADSFRGDGSVRSWLLRIVARECIRAYRKANAEGNRIVRKQRLAPAQEAQAAPAAPGDSEELVALRASVAQLPERQRTLLALYFGAEMSQEEIGEHLAMPQSTVSRAIQDLLDQLRGSLARAGLAAAVPVLGAEQMQAAVLGGESAPAGLLEGILSRLAGAGRSASVKAATVSSSPTWIAWAAAVLALSAGAWWALQAPQDKPLPAEAPAATAAEAPEAPASEPEVKTEPPAAGPGVYGYRWTFEGRISSEFERLSGKTRFVKDKRTGVHGLHFDPKMETCYLLRVPLRDKPVRVRATVVEIPLADRQGAMSNFSFALTDGETTVSSSDWRVADHIDWRMKEVDTFTYYISGEWAFAYAGGGVRTVVQFERKPADRFLAITGQYIVLKVLELKELEPGQLPAELRDPQKLIAKMEPGMTIPRVSIRPEAKGK